MQMMITMKLQVIADDILTVGSDPTPVLQIPKTVNACWKPPPENFWKTIRRSSKRNEHFGNRAAAPLNIYSV